MNHSIQILSFIKYLCFSAADEFDTLYQSSVTLDYNGSAEQIPPGMFKSTCKINIRWFPFDEQECTMKFGSWTYDGTKIDLQFLDGIPEGSTAGFALNGEWEVIGKCSIRRPLWSGRRRSTRIHDTLL